MTDIVIVGEAWGEQEERERTPFVGASGKELTRMLEEAGIRRSDCYLTNVFNLRPQGNKIETLCVSKKEDRSHLPPLSSGKYLDIRYLDHLARLYTEIDNIKPNLVVALGNTPAWALLHNSGITKIRGTVSYCAIRPTLKVLPTFHPAAVLRQWDLRAVTVLDLQKAKAESLFPEIRRPERTFYIAETLDDIRWFKQEKIDTSRHLAFDIETHANQITCIGFAPSPQEALVVPFFDWEKPKNNSHWPTLEEELQAWDLVEEILRGSTLKIAQNGLFDIQHLWKYGIPVANFEDDTMLGHHALQPESQKGLGFLGSVYTSEPAWKMMRTRGRDALKKDE